MSERAEHPSPGDENARDALVALMGELARSATPITPVVTGCDLLVLRPGRPKRPEKGLPREHRPLRSASDPFAQAIACIQDEIGEGPSIDVLHTARAVVTPDLSADPGTDPAARWPSFTAAARAHAVAAIHAEPLISTDQRLLGVMTWYAKAPGTFHDPRLPGLTERARTVAHTLSLARRLLGLRVHPEDLHAALASRTLIAQATGLLMQRHSCTSDEAFAQLAEISRREQTKLHATAAVLLNRATRPRQAGPSTMSSTGRQDEQKAPTARSPIPLPVTPRP